MNTTKTKIVWIGRKKHSKDKLICNSKLDWGTTCFTLLGILFSVKLKNIPLMNFTKALEIAKKLLSDWKKRLLTPIGKITIIKTFVLPQFIHLFTSIPSPSKEFIKKLNEMFYNFIWDNKPDKIKRKYITQDHKNAGLRMVDLDTFIVSLKLSWIDRIVKSSRKDYIIIFEKSMSPLNKFLKMGMDWTKMVIQKSNNIFWNQVLSTWVKFSENAVISDNNDILTCPIWYNPLISKNSFYFPKWYKNGISMVGDILNNQGQILEQREIERKYNLSQVNFLDYHSVKVSVSNFLAKNKIGNTFALSLHPCIPIMYLFYCLIRRVQKFL